MDTRLDERINSIVAERISEHTADENHHDIDGAVQDAIGDLDLDDAVERAFKNSVNWEDYVKELVESEVAALVDDDHMHDKVREVLNEVTFTVSVD
jgi:hypothetical protein